MPRPRLHPEQNRVALRRLVWRRVFGDGVLQGSSVLVRVQRGHAVVVVARHDQQRRIVLRALGRDGDVVERGPLGDRLELFRVARVSEVGPPRVADRELVEADHVLDAHRGQTRRVEVGPLVYAGRDQRAAVGRALNREARRGSKVEFDEVLGGGLEVVKDFLLLEGAGAGVAPGDTVLAAW